MELVRGIKASKGITMGRVYYRSTSVPEIFSYKVDNIEVEYQRYIYARAQASDQVEELYQKAQLALGGDSSLVFTAHKAILFDPIFNDEVEGYIRTEGYNAEYAVNSASCKLVQIFESMSDDYFRERADDIKDISNRLLEILSSEKQELEEETNASSDDVSIPVILASEDFMPSDTMRFDNSKVLGFISEFGGIASHAAILARMMDKPAVVGIGKSLEGLNGKYCILDGASGVVIVEPDEKTLRLYTQMQRNQTKQTERLKSMIGLESVTKDGMQVRLYANMGSPNDLPFVLQNDARGIGLFRSEFLYMDNTDFPTEEQQFEAYRSVLEGMEGKPVTVRTLDIGSDKSVDYFDNPQEKNPALGFRAIRISLEMHDQFRAQLRSLMRASIYGKLSIMFPMVVNEQELDCILKIVEMVKKELKFEHTPFDDDVRLGIMIETPAAAIISDKLAKKVNFFSIGTNDLTQYTLAVDRTNAKVSYLYNTSDLGVLRLIKLTADNAHKVGIPVSICGESASDVSLLATFLSMGIDGLSVAPNMVLEVREEIRKLNVKKVKASLLNRLM